MRYQIRLLGQLGSLMSRALGENVSVGRVPPHTFLTVSDTSSAVPDLLRVLSAHGIEVARLRLVVDREEQHETSGGPRQPSGQ